MHDLDDDDTYVLVEGCARRLGLSLSEVMELVSKRVLKARRYGGWLLEVQPALIPGVTTSTPDREKEDEKMRVDDVLRMLRDVGDEPDIDPFYQD
jgi:hypothetical protein